MFLNKEHICFGIYLLIRSHHLFHSIHHFYYKNFLYNPSGYLQFLLLRKQPQEKRMHQSWQEGKMLYASPIKVYSDIRSKSRDLHEL